MGSDELASALSFLCAGPRPRRLGRRPARGSLRSAAPGATSRGQGAAGCWVSLWFFGYARGDKSVRVCSKVIQIFQIKHI